MTENPAYYYYLVRGRDCFRNANGISQGAYPRAQESARLDGYKETFRTKT